MPYRMWMKPKRGFRSTVDKGLHKVAPSACLKRKFGREYYYSLTHFDLSKTKRTAQTRARRYRDQNKVRITKESNRRARGVD